MDHVTHRVQSPPSGAPRHLGILVGIQQALTLAVEFSQSRKHSRLDRTVETNGKRLGGKEHLDVFLGNHQLDHFAQNGNHARVVNANALFQQTHHQTILWHLHVLVEIRQLAQNLLTLARHGIAHLAVVFQHWHSNFLRTRLDQFPTKHEENGGQHVPIAQKERQLVQDEFPRTRNRSMGL